MKRTLALILGILMLLAAAPLSVLAEDTTITVWMGSWWEEQAPKVMEAFNNDPANAGYKLVIETFPNNAYVEKIIAAVLGGSAPDVADVDVTFLGALMRRDLLVEFTADELKDQNIEDFNAGAWNAGVFGGKVYAIPNRGGMGEATVYNKALFDKAGVPYPEDTWTLADYMDICGKLLAGGNGEFYPTGVAVSTTDPANFESSFSFILLGHGANWVNEEQTAVTMDTPEAIAAIQYFLDLFTNKYVPEGCINYTIANDVLPLFTEGKVAMMNYSDAWVKAVKDSGMDYGVTTTPSQRSRTGGWTFVVPVSAPNPDASKKFILWFTQPDKLGELMIRTPARASTNRDYEPWNSDDYKYFALQAATAKAPPSLPEWTELRLIIIEEMQKAIMGQQTAEEAGAAMTKRGNELIAESAN